MDDACAPAPHLLVEYYELLTSRDNGRIDNFARARTRAPTGVIAPNPAPIATAGSCAVHVTKEEPGPSPTFVGECFDMGPVSLTIPGGTKSARECYLGEFHDDLAFGNLRLLDTGETLSVSAPGGADVGAFDVQVAAPPPLEMNAPAYSPGTSLTISWPPGDSGMIEIYAGRRMDVIDSVWIRCDVPDAAGSVTLDASLTGYLQPFGEVFGYRTARAKFETPSGFLVEVSMTRNDYHPSL